MQCHIWNRTFTPLDTWTPSLNFREKTNWLSQSSSTFAVATQPTPTKAQTEDSQLKPPPLHRKCTKSPITHSHNTATPTKASTEHNQGKKIGLLSCVCGYQLNLPNRLGLLFFFLGLSTILVFFFWTNLMTFCWAWLWFV